MAPEHPQPTTDQRCVLIIDRALPAGLAANAAAVLALSIGARNPALIGPDFTDADNGHHHGLIPFGLPVLATDATQLTTLRTQANQRGMHLVDFPTSGQRTTDYTTFTATVRDTRADAITYLGIGLCGNRKRIRSLTGNLPLLR